MKKVSLLLAALLCLTALTLGLVVVTSAEDVTYSGTHGSLAWTLNETTGELVISGSGSMKDFMSDTESVAWRTRKNLTSGGDNTEEGWGPLHPASVSVSYAAGADNSSWKYPIESITKVTVQAGVTSIGAYAFEGFENLETVLLPKTVASIGAYAFGNDASLTEIIFCDTESAWNNVSKDATWAQGSDSSALLCHKFGEGVVTTEPTTTTEGVKTFTCTICGATKTEAIEPIGLIKGTWGDLTWKFNEATGALVISGNGAMGDFDFSSTDAWRAYKTSIQTLEIANSVTTIGARAFSDCTGLKTVTIPSNITSIGYSAFSSCSNLTSITFSENSQLVSIGESAFSSCKKLTSITLPDSVTSLGNFAFSGCQKLSSVTLSNNITTIGTYTFSSCANLTSIVIPSNVRHIKQYAFSNCTSLESVAFSNNLISIEDFAFSTCSALKEILIPKSVTSLGNQAFYMSKNLSSLTVASGNTVYHSTGNCIIETASKTLLIGCHSSIIPNDGSVTSIGESAFFDCDNLISIVIPDHITSIGKSAFNSCSKLENVNIGSGVTTICEKAFAYCTKLTDITFSQNSQLEFIHDYAFSDCENLKSISIPKSITTIGYSAFGYCKALETVNFEWNSQLEYIGDRAFETCWTLINISIPNNVTIIGNYAFYNCQSLASITYYGTEENWNTKVAKYNNWDLDTGNYTVYFHTEHTWDMGAVTLAPTTTSEGVLTHTCTLCGATKTAAIAKVANVTFQHSMQAFLNLESEVTMSVGYKIEGMEDINPSDYLGRFGLLIWNASECPDEAAAIYSNCAYIVHGAIYNAEEGRFETTTLGIPAKKLGDQLCFRAFYCDENGNYSYSRLITNYSPKTYCYNQIKNNPNNEKLVNLMASILNYGTAAQIHFEYNLDDLMNANLTEEQKLMNWDGTLVRNDYSVPNGKDSSLVRDNAVTSRGGYLDLEGAIDYNFYAKVNFTPVKATIYYWTEADVADLESLTLENATSSEDMTWIAEKERWEGKFEGQAAKRMFNTVYACMVFEDAEGNTVVSGVIGYSPERYAFINQDKGDTNAELAKRLAVYGDAARAYFE